MYLLILSQLNTDRGIKRRKPNTFDSVLEPLNDELFNFTKVNPEEYLFNFSNILNNYSGKFNFKFLYI